MIAASLPLLTGMISTTLTLGALYPLTHYLDITALALNMLKPRYSVSILKDLYLTEEDLEQHDRDVKQSVTEAIKKVAARPHHY